MTHTIVNNNVVSVNDIEKIIDYEKENDEMGSDAYIIEKQYIQDRFLWIYCQYDNMKIYGKYIVDKEKNKKEKNTRMKSKVELRYQFFAIYDMETKLFYISNIKKRKFIESYLSKAIGSSVVSKEIYSSLDEFEKSVKYLKQIRFTQARNILNCFEHDDIFNPVNSNLYGLDLPQKLSLQLDFSFQAIGKIKQVLLKFKHNRDKGYYDNIVLIGEDDKGIEQQFNYENVIKSLDITPSKNSDERYDEDEVRKMIVERIMRL